MYAIREAHIDVETGERKEIEQFVAWFFGFNSEGTTTLGMLSQTMTAVAL